MKRIRFEILAFISSIVISLLTFQQICMLEYVYSEAIRKTFTYYSDVVIIVCCIAVAFVAGIKIAMRLADAIESIFNEPEKKKSEYFIDM